MSIDLLNSWLVDIGTAVTDEDAGYIADELSNDENKRLTWPNTKIHEVERSCSRKLEEPWNDMVFLHLKVGWAIDQNDFVAAFDNQVKVAQSFYRVFVSLSRWALPIGYAVCADLRHLAILADAQLAKKGEKTGKLEEAARTISKAFSICTTDRSPTSQSRKWGTYHFINQLFRIYFKIKRQNLCVNVLRSLKVTDLPALSRYPIPQQATFQYYEGVLFFLKEDYANAEQCLDISNRMCRDTCLKNKRLILEILLPTKMLRGVLPNMHYLRQHKTIFRTYAPFVEAIVSGNVKEFDEALVTHEKRLLQVGTYLIVEKARALAVRRLFKKVYLIMDRSTRIPLSAFQLALKCAGVDVETDEVECMLANMIYKGYMKGYISHEKSMVVLSAQAAFPTLTGFVPNTQ